MTCQYSEKRILFLFPKIFATFFLWPSVKFTESCYQCMMQSFWCGTSMKRINVAPHPSIVNFQSFWCGTSMKRINVAPHPSIVNFIGYIICSICSTKISKVERSFQNLAFCRQCSRWKLPTAGKGGATMQKFLFIFACINKWNLTFKMKTLIYWNLNYIKHKISRQTKRFDYFFCKNCKNWIIDNNFFVMEIDKNCLLTH